MTKIIAIYARVSTEKQNESNTIDSQVHELKVKTAKDGALAVEVKEFIDNGYSGSNLIRPALEKLRDEVMMGDLGKIYIHSPDRLARKYAHQVVLLEEFERAGVEVEFLNCVIDDNPESQLLLQMQGMMAEYERAKIIERNRRGKLHAAKSGCINVLGGAPYGYHYINKHDGNGKASYVINELEATNVKQIYHWYGIEKLSLNQIISKLKKQGQKTRKGNLIWDAAVISGILKNPAYVGNAAYGKSKSVKPMRLQRHRRNSNPFPRRARSVQQVSSDQWIYISVPRIINDKLFSQVKIQLEENKKRMRLRKKGASYLLQGLLRCDYCRYSLYAKLAYDKRGQRKTEYGYYRCPSMDTHRLKGREKCLNKMIRSDALEEAIWTEVCYLLRNPNLIKTEYWRRISNLNKESDQEKRIKILDNKLGQLNTKIDRITGVYIDGHIKKDVFEYQIKLAKNDLLDVISERRSLTNLGDAEQSMEAASKELEKFSMKICKELDTADWQKKRDIMCAIIKRIEVGKEKINIVYNLNPADMSALPEKFSREQEGQHCGWRN